MKNDSTFTLFCAGALMIGITGITLMTNAQVKQGKSRLMKTSQFMEGVVKPSCKALKESLAAGPDNDEDWAKVLMHAAILNEASFTLMDDGRCPDGTWAGAASKTLRDGSAEIFKAAEAKDIAAALPAFKAMTKSCKECHKAHKEDK